MWPGSTSGSSIGSEITQALEKQVWGDFYGELVDPWGVAWMFNIAAPDGWAKTGS